MDRPRGVVYVMGGRGKNSSAMSARSFYLLSRTSAFLRDLLAMEGFVWYFNAITESPIKEFFYFQIILIAPRVTS